MGALIFWTMLEPAACAFRRFRPRRSGPLAVAQEARDVELTAEADASFAGFLAGLLSISRRTPSGTALGEVADALREAEALGDGAALLDVGDAGGVVNGDRVGLERRLDFLGARDLLVEVLDLGDDVFSSCALLGGEVTAFDLCGLGDCVESPTRSPLASELGGGLHGVKGLGVWMFARFARKMADRSPPRERVACGLLRGLWRVICAGLGVWASVGGFVGAPQMSGGSWRRLDRRRPSRRRHPRGGQAG